MDSTDDTLTLDELAERSGMEPRTIRSYVSKGLIPRPSRGRGAKYEASTLQRLMAIKHLMAETGCSLDYCRRIFLSLDEEEIARIAKGEPQTVADHMISPMFLFDDDPIPPLVGEQMDLIENTKISKSAQIVHSTICDMRELTKPTRIAGGEAWVVVPITDDLVIHIREDSEQLDQVTAEKVIKTVRGLVDEEDID